MCVNSGSSPLCVSLVFFLVLFDMFFQTISTFIDWRGRDCCSLLPQCCWTLPRFMGPVRLPRCSIPASPVSGVAALFSFPTFQHLPLGLAEALCKGSKAWASPGWASHVPLPFLWHTGNKCTLPGAMRLNTLLLASLLCWGWKNGVVLFQHCSSFAPSQGGGGALARECVSLYPNCTVTIYDLPKVVQVAKDQFIPPEEQRIAFHEGKHGQVYGRVLVGSSRVFICGVAGDRGLLHLVTHMGD